MNRTLTAGALVGIWLLLQPEVSAGVLVTAAAVALLVAIAWRPLRGEPAPRIHWRPALALAALVVWDVVIANLEVARRILGPAGAVRSGWVEVPLDLTDPHAISTLAAIVTMTPGTLSVDVTADRVLLVHALHVDDAAALCADIKSRYERRVMEVLR